MSYDNTNRGVLWKNANKKESKHPDYHGTIFVSPELAGQEINIAAWLKETGPQSKSPGTKFLSLQVSPMRTQRTSSNTQRTPNHTQSTSEKPPFDDDIPF